jgi:hypothetical protein
MFGEEVALGVISNIVYGGLTRVAGGVTVSVQRRQAIERSLTNPKDAKAKAFKRAIDDLQMVVANRFGANTQRFDDFLNELNRSAFPEILTETVLNGADNIVAKHIFDSVFQNYKETPEFKQLPDNLFSAIEVAVRAQYDMLSAESELLASISAKSNAICTKIERLVKTVDSIKLFNQQRTLTKARVDDIRVKLCKQIETKHRYITVETARGARKYSVSKLFIEPNFTRLNYDELSVPTRSKSRNAPSSRPEDLFRIGYAELRNTLRRTVILGDPGGGKSTTVQHICFEFARLVSLAIEHPDRKGIDPTRQRLPIRIVLRAFETRKRQHSSLSILDVIVDEMSELLSEERAEVEEFIKYCLISGTAVVLFDGLDEVLSVKSRREFVEFIEQFADTFPSASIMVTSRFVGYMDAPLNPQYECLSLAEFGPDQIADYSRKSLAVIKGVKESSVERDVKSFLDQTSRNASDLRVNPLMLALMVWLFAIKGDVPANRPEIYKECATLMFEKWDQNRGILFGIPSDFELIDLFGFIANEIFGKAELEEGVSKEWLFKKLKSYFSHWYEEKAKGVEVSKSLVEFLVGRAWVLSEVGQDVFKFTHRTFLEYFYARYANAQLDAVVDLISKLRPRIIQGEMDVVNHLSLQMFTFREPRKMNQAVSVLTNLLSDEQLSDFEAGNALIFFSRSLEYLVMSEMQYRDALAILIKRLLEVGAAGETFVTGALGHCVAHAGQRMQILQQTAKSTFEVALAERPNQHNFIVNIISNGPIRRKNKNVFVTAQANRTMAYQKLMGDLRTITLPAFAKLGNNDIVYARMAIEIGPAFIDRYFRKYGCEILFSRLQTDNFHGRTAMGRIARLLGTSLRIYSQIPWIEIDVDALGDFLSKILASRKITRPQVVDNFVARDISSTFQQLSHSGIQLNTTAVEASATAAYKLALAVLSEMEFALVDASARGRQGGCERLKKRKESIHRIVSQQGHKTHSQVLANWLQSPS